MTPVAAARAALLQQSSSMPPKRKSERASDIEAKKKRDELRHGLVWQNHGDATRSPYIPPLLYLTSAELSGRSKVAAFDIDSTLIETKSGRKFATGNDDAMFQ